MRNFQDKKNKQFWRSIPILVLLSIILFIFTWNVFVFWRKMVDTRNNRNIAKEKITQLQQQKDKLSADIAKLNTDKGVEEAIRDKFGLVKEGEGMIVIVEDKNKEVVPPPSRFSGFLSFFKNLFN